MNDQQRITEAYKLVQEWSPLAAPEGTGMRAQFDTWAKSKLAGALGPLGRNAQNKYQGRKEFQDEVNQLKYGIQRYLSRAGLSKENITGKILAEYLRNSGQSTPTVTELNKPPVDATVLKDNVINQYIIKSTQEHVRNNPIARPPTQQNQNQQQNQSQLTISQKEEAKQIAMALRLLRKSTLVSTDLLRVLQTRNLVLTKNNRAVDQNTEATALMQLLRGQKITSGIILKALTNRGLKLAKK